MVEVYVFPRIYPPWKKVTVELNDAEEMSPFARFPNPATVDWRFEYVGYVLLNPITVDTRLGVEKKVVPRPLIVDFR